MRACMRRAAVAALLVLVMVATLAAMATAGRTVTPGIQTGSGGIIMKGGTMYAKTAGGTTRGTLVATTGVLSFAPASTTGTAWLLDFSTLTTGNGLALKYLSGTLTTGKVFEVLGGAAGATSELSVLTGGELVGSGPKHYISVPLGCTANTTAYTGVFAVQRAVTITKASVCFVAKPSSSSGTVTLALSNTDASASADDNLLSAATVDLEGLTNKTVSDLTLTSTSADLVLADGDYVFATAVSNNADMTGGTGGVLTLEYTLQ